MAGEKKINNISLASLEFPNDSLSRAKGLDKKSARYIGLTALAGGVAGCSAKTLIAPLDRVKILFQTSNPQFKEFSSSFFGLYKASRRIYSIDGFVGFFQGHSVTLIRIFPYAAIKFVTYEQIRNLLIPNDLYETNGRRLLAGAISGVISVYFTYPLDLLRVRLAFETGGYSKAAASGTRRKVLGSGKLKTIIQSIQNEPTRCKDYKYIGLIPDKLLGITNFYRGFVPTILGMIPYAGVSFWTHDFVHDIFRSKWLSSVTLEQKLAPKPGHSHDKRAPLKAWAQLIAGGVAGLVSQTAAYPFEVIRRRLQVGAVMNQGEYFTVRQMALIIYKERGVKGFYVGLGIGYIKVIPMVACSFFVYERLKFMMGI